MGAARLGAYVAALALAVLASASLSPILLASSAPLPLVLTVRMIATQELDPLTDLALRHEAESIWRPGHITLRWVPDDADIEGGAFLKMLVMARPGPNPARNSRWIAGELVRPEGAPAMAIASITAARRVVDERRRLPLLDSPATDGQRLGVVLGRVLAHEIGHYLLHTKTHAAEGLMRARIAAHEFADLRTGAFRLDKAAQTHLATLAASGTLSLQPSSAERFSYPRR